MKNRIVSREYFELGVRLDSPLSVSNGENSMTDSDVMINRDCQVFVPGTSLAGAFRNYLEQKKNQKGIMGFSDGEDGRMSSVFISDLYFDSVPVVSVRDGVKLTDEKLAADASKYDMEIVETGASGRFRIEVVRREKDDFDDISETIRQLVKGMNSGDIRFGKKKNRGFGRLTVVAIKSAAFSSVDCEKWIAFCQNPEYPVDYSEWLNESEGNDKFIKIRIPLKLQGGISIRTYATQKGAPDYSHIECNNMPVVPGSSWNGAIRSDAIKILKELGCTNPEKKVDVWFGADAKKNKDMKQSAIVFSESVIEDSVAMTTTRNRINRFSGGTVDGALYTDRAFYGGKTVLEILINNRCEYREALLGLVCLIIKDIQNGYVSIGGLSSIGRGLFAVGDQPEEYFGIAKNETVWLEQLYALICA